MEGLRIVVGEKVTSPGGEKTSDCDAGNEISLEGLATTIAGREEAKGVIRCRKLRGIRRGGARDMGGSVEKKSVE